MAMSILAHFSTTAIQILFNELPICKAEAIENGLKLLKNNELTNWLCVPTNQPSIHAKSKRKSKKKIKKMKERRKLERTKPEELAMIRKKQCRRRNFKHCRCSEVIFSHTIHKYKKKL